MDDICQPIPGPNLDNHTPSPSSIYRPIQVISRDPLDFRMAYERPITRSYSVTRIPPTSPPRRSRKPPRQPQQEPQQRPSQPSQPKFVPQAFSFFSLPPEPASPLLDDIIHDNTVGGDGHWEQSNDEVIPFKLENIVLPDDKTNATAGAPPADGMESWMTFASYGIVREAYERFVAEYRLPQASISPALPLPPMLPSITSTAFSYDKEKELPSWKIQYTRWWAEACP